MGDTLTLAQARALWWQKQALGRASTGPLGTVLAKSGWLRTLGGADVYLAARARRPGMKREELDAVMESGELRVVPAARGCIYVVPAAMVGDLMALNAGAWRKSAEKDLAKVGSSMAVIEGLAKGVLAALTVPMTTDAVRKALPAEAIPSFGDVGKKAGISSPLPFVLRLLELQGKVERTLERGRLDSDRYLWRKAEWPVAPAAAEPLDSMIGAFLDFAGPVTLGHMNKWSGVAQRDLKPVIQRLGAVPVTIDGIGDAWVRTGDIGAAMRAPPPTGVALLAFEDNYLVSHGTLGAVTDARHHAIEANIWGGDKPEALGTADHVLSRTIVIDGLISGFWEVDPSTKGAVWMTFEPASKLLAGKLDELTHDAAKFLLGEIGHARVFSLDTMELVQDRANRVADLRDGKKPRAAMAKPAAVKPVAVKPPAPPKPVKAPAPAKLVAAKPAAKKPAAKQPAAKQPAAKKPA
ncbi:MAG: hypothetical protein H6Q90_6028, partial [Deltaproteobacteria bacterium]|nr:hypothetical protein [Deltaproteobacteria bacterium]